MSYPLENDMLNCNTDDVCIETYEEREERRNEMIDMDYDMRVENYLLERLAQDEQI